MSVHVLPFAAQSLTGRAPAPTVSSAPGAPASVPLRLTRRGRLVLVGAPLMIAAAALLAFIGFFTAPAMA